MYGIIDGAHRCVILTELAMDDKYPEYTMSFLVPCQVMKATIPMPLMIAIATRETLCSDSDSDTDSDSDVHMGIARPPWWFEMIELGAWNKSHTLPETVLDIVILYLEAPHHYGISQRQHDSYWYTSSQPESTSVIVTAGIIDSTAAITMPPVL